MLGKGPYVSRTLCLTEYNGKATKSLTSPEGGKASPGGTRLSCLDSPIHRFLGQTWHSFSAKPLQPYIRDHFWPRLSLSYESLLKLFVSSTSLNGALCKPKKILYTKQISQGRAPLALRLRVQKLLQASFFSKEKSSWGCFLRGSQTLRVPIQAVPIQGRP